MDNIHVTVRLTIWYICFFSIDMPSAQALSLNPNSNRFTYGCPDPKALN